MTTAGRGLSPPSRVPEFPAFAEVSLDFAAELHSQFARLHARPSEFTFANLFAFRAAHGFRISRMGAQVLIVGKGYDGVSYAYPPIGPGDPGAALQALCGYMTDAGCAPRFFPVPLPWAEAHLPPADWEVTPDRDQADYVYRRDDLAELAGRRYHRKRNRILKLRRESGEALRFQVLAAEHRAACLDLAATWCGIRCAPERPSTYAETAAVQDALLHTQVLGLVGGVLLAGDRVQAFCLGEALGGDTFVVHFEKVVPGQEGLAQMINQEFCRHALGAYEFVNREQDLGDPGLRQAKLGYHPAFLLEKAWARPR